MSSQWSFGYQWCDVRPKFIMTIAMMNMSRWNCFKKKSCHYFDIKSARRRVPHCGGVPVTVIACVILINMMRLWILKKQSMKLPAVTTTFIIHIWETFRKDRTFFSNILIYYKKLMKKINKIKVWYPIKFHTSPILQALHVIVRYFIWRDIWLPYSLIWLPSVIGHHVVIPSALVLLLHSLNILVENFPLFLRHQGFQGICSNG